MVNKIGTLLAKDLGGKVMVNKIGMVLANKKIYSQVELFYWAVDLYEK